MTITREPVLTEQQRRELDETGHTMADIEKAPWYHPLMAQSAKLLFAACAGMGLFIFNGYNEAQSEQADATRELAKAFNGLEKELVQQRGQLSGLAETMRQLSSRQDSAIATAERAMSEQAGLRSRVELLQYYVLEFDGKLIAAGIVAPRDSVALKLRKQQEDTKQ